jgi:flagellar hook-length control protein FliK
MMPAISLTPLPTIPPFQYLPEADLNFEAVLEAVPVPLPPAPAQPAPFEPNVALLNFLGVNPVKAQTVAPESPAIKEETLDDETPASTELFSPEGGSPAFTIEVSAIPPTLPPSRENSAGLAGEPSTIAFQPTASALLPKPPVPLNVEEKDSTSRDSVQWELSATVSPSVPSAEPSKPFGLSQSKPRLSLDHEEKGSTSTSSVRTEFGVLSIPLTQPSLSEAREPSPAQPIANTPPTDPLRFTVERQLDLARDSRWLDALARDIVAVAETPDRLSFRLSPPQLGRLDVDLSASDNGLSVRMNASSEAATQIIAAAQPRLIDELRNQGVRVAEAQVSTGSGGQPQGQNQQQQRDADQMIEFARARFERAAETNLTRPTGRFA